MINTNNSRNTNNEVSETINSLLTSSKRDLIKKEFKTTIKPNNLNLLLDDTNIIKKTGSLKKKINGKKNKPDEEVVQNTTGVSLNDMLMISDEKHVLMCLRLFN